LDLPVSGLYLLAAPSTPDEVREAIVQLKVKGLSQPQIAAAVGASQRTVCNDLREQSCSESEQDCAPIEVSKTDILAAAKVAACYFSPTETVSIFKEVEPIERALAKERLVESGRVGGKGLGNFPDPSKGRALDKIGAALGLTRREWSDRIGLTIRDKAERLEATRELKAEGLSNRAIADVLGVDESTIRADAAAGNPALTGGKQETEPSGGAGNPALPTIPLTDKKAIADSW
jgi:DNA-binding CsgD family transcriptional regulator